MSDAETPTEHDVSTTRTRLTKDAVTETTTGYVVDPGSGDEFEATFKDITKAERQELGELEEQAAALDRLGEGELAAMTDAELEELIADAEAAEQTFTERIVDDYLLHDEFTAENTGQAMKGAILVGFLRAIGADNEAIREGEEFFENRLNAGNR